VTPAYLAEVSERDATGTVAAIYAEIRQVLDVPVVNLIYRHLAADERRLEATWAAVRPALAHPATRGLAASLARTAEEVRPHVESIDREAALLGGIAATDMQRARATFTVYERANALNLLAARALAHGAPGVEAERHVASARPVPDAEILPMADLGGLDEHTHGRLVALSRAVTAPGDDVLIPSLYRHLASVPLLFQLIAEATEAALARKALAAAGAAVRRQAQELALRLPLRVEPTTDVSVRAVVERFEPAIASMLVAGRVLDAVLAPASR